MTEPFCSSCERSFEKNIVDLFCVLVEILYFCTKLVHNLCVVMD